MTDPLSISVGLLTILQGGLQVGQSIARLKNVGKLPNEFSSLFAEAADLNYVLQECCSVDRAQLNFDPSQSRSATEATLERHATQAQSKLLELQGLLESQTAPAGASSRADVRAFWGCLVHGKSRLNRFRDELRDVRLALSATLQLLTNSVVQSINSSIGDIAANQQQINTSQQELRELVQSISQQARAAALQGPVSDDNDSLYHRRSSAPNITSTNMTVRKPDGPHRRRTLATSVIPTVEDPLKKACVSWCSCQCHSPSSIRTPGPFRDLIGALSITHSGLPYFTRACTQKKCRRRASPQLRMSYRLPKFWAERLFTMSMSTGDFAGPEVRVRLPRIVGWTSPIWQYATNGDVKSLQNLFSSGQASPWDVNPFNSNLLHYVTDHWSPELCHMLLEAGVDPMTEDEFKNTGVGIAWERVLSGQMPADDSSIVASLFEDADYLSARSFTIIHKIVLGLLPKDLDYELECSTAEIDMKDSRGRTALSWAAARGDEDAMSILLHHGADVHLADVCLETPLHHVRNTACAQLLIDAGADLGALNDEGAIPLHKACMRIRSASLVDYLISRGSDVNAPDSLQVQTPLHVGLSNPPALPFIDVLLENGADINARNNSRDTPLRFAIMTNQHAVLRRMLEPDFQADFTGYNTYGQSFSHAIARTADIETLNILTAACPRSLVPEIDAMDTNNKTSMDYLRDRLQFLEEDASLHEAFQRLIDVLQKGDMLSRVQEIGEATAKRNMIVMVSEVDSSPADEIEEIFHEAIEAI